MNSIFAYAGAKGGPVQYGPDGAIFIAVWNRLATPATMAKGAVYEILFSDDATDSYFPFPKIPATQSTVMHVVGVVNNFHRQDGTILTATWGWLQTKGYCENVLSTTDVVNEDSLTTTNATTLITDTGAATLAANTFAIAKGARTGSGLFPAYLLGNLVALP